MSEQTLPEPAWDADETYRRICDAQMHLRETDIAAGGFTEDITTLLSRAERDVHMARRLYVASQQDAAMGPPHDRDGRADADGQNPDDDPDATALRPGPRESAPSPPYAHSEQVAITAGGAGASAPLNSWDNRLAAMDFDRDSTLVASVEGRPRTESVHHGLSFSGVKDRDYYGSHVVGELDPDTAREIGVALLQAADAAETGRPEQLVPEQFGGGLIDGLREVLRGEEGEQ